MSRIVSEWELGREQTWNEFVRWYGVHAGEHDENDLLAEIAGGAPEIEPIARAEMARRDALEADSC